MRTWLRRLLCMHSVVQILCYPSGRAYVARCLRCGKDLLKQYEDARLPF